MRFTGQLGTTGLLQPGYHCTGRAVFRGPAPAYVQGIGLVQAGQTLAVTPTVASQFAVSDQGWWEFH